MFVFDWINWSQLKHLLDPEAIVNSDGQCWLGDDPLLSHQDRSPCPHYLSPHDTEYSWAPAPHPQAPMVSARVTGLRLMTHVNISNVKHNVTCCPMPFEWWIVHESQNMCVSDDVKLSPIRKCLMLNDWGLCLSGPRPGKHRRGQRGRVSPG